jgi:hypothetical protein
MIEFLNLVSGRAQVSRETTGHPEGRSDQRFRLTARRRLDWTLRRLQANLVDVSHETRALPNEYARGKRVLPR